MKRFSPFASFGLIAVVCAMLAACVTLGCIATSGDLARVADRVDQVAVEVDKTAGALEKVEVAIAAEKAATTPEAKAKAQGDVTESVSLLVESVKASLASLKDAGAEARAAAEAARARGETATTAIGGAMRGDPSSIAELVLGAAALFATHKVTKDKVNAERNASRAEALAKVHARGGAQTG